MRLPSMLVALLVGCVLITGGAAAQTVALAPAPPAPTAHIAAAPNAAAVARAEPPKLTPAEAQSVLDVLTNPQKREAFIATLQNIMKATAPAPGSAPGSAPGPAPAAALAVPVVPNSLVGTVMANSDSWLAQLGAQVSAFRNVLGNLPAVWAFAQRTFKNPAARDTVITAGWHLGLIFAVAVLVEWAFYLLLKRPIAALARRAPSGSLRPPAEAAAAAASGGDEDRTQTIMRERRFARLLRLVKRLPFVFARLILELLPVATFLGLAYAGVTFADVDTQPVLWVAVTAYVAARLAVILTRAITAPDHQSLRMVHTSDEGAAYAVRWMRRLAAVAALTYAAGAIGVIFNMPLPAREALAKALMLLDHIFLIIIVLQCRASVAAKLRGDGSARGLTAEIRARLAGIWHLAAIFFIVALWLIWAAQVRNGYSRMWHIFLITAAVLVVARVAAILLLAGLDRAFRISPDMSRRYPTLEAQANRYYPLVRGTLVTSIFLATGLCLLLAWGVKVQSWFNTGAVGGKLFSAAITIVIAGAITLLIWEGTNASLERHLDHLTRDAQPMKSARLRTLMPILRTVLLLTLMAVFGLTALSEIGLNIAPLLAGAGILGVAIGFGSQKLVQDFITGIFLLLENAMQVGDAVTVAGLSGSVENLSIRTMRLRAGDGSVHIIPFSSVTTVTNSNRGIGNAAVSVSVPVAEDTDRVSEVLADIAGGMREDRKFAGLIRSDLQLWGVDKVDAGVVTVVGQIVCTDNGRWSVQREFNRRLNIRFKELGIRIATPTQTVFNHQVDPLEPKTPDPKQQVEAAEPPPETVRESPPPSALGHTS